MVKDLRLFLNGIATSWKGMRLTLSHLRKSGHRQKNQDVQSPDYFSDRDGQSTLVYPYEEIPVPDHGRYQLHNEIEDCIVCDKCAKICPVDCIDIEPIKSAEEFGKTSDGTSKRIYAATFDIDMAKCCFCGLCTTVCPTECLTMTPEYDFSVFDLRKLNFGFGNMTEDEAAQKRTEWEVAQQKKAEAKAAAEKPAPSADAPPRPAGFQPRMRPAAVTKPEPVAEESKAELPSVSAQPEEEKLPSASNESTDTTSTETPPAYKPRMRPMIKAAPSEEPKESPSVAPKPEEEKEPSAITDGTESTPNEAPPAYKPRMRPVIKAAPSEENQPKTEPTPTPETSAEPSSEPSAETETKPAYVPRMRPRPVMKKPDESSSNPSPESPHE